MMGSDNPNAPAGWKPSHTVNVSEFKLDKYEVTVGRFRRFVEAYPGSFPNEGDGAHPRIANSGWVFGWGSYLPTSAAALAHICDGSPTPSLCTWTDTPGANENKPMNGLSWYAAFAFCAWDGGRLATEAEWEYAAAGGDSQSVFPWGNDNKTITCDRANIGTWDLQSCGGAPDAVGTRPLGQGRWHQLDLVGNVSEWTLDWYSADWYTTGGASCTDCANLTSATYRTRRGGSFSVGFTQAPVYFRDLYEPTYPREYIGVRCARDVP